MATYLILNLLFIAVVLLLLKLVGVPSWDRTMTWVLALLIVLTALFDSLIIAVGIVDYDPSKILGLRLGYAPIEDFMYAILALIIIPTIWKKLETPSA